MPRSIRRQAQRRTLAMWSQLAEDRSARHTHKGATKRSAMNGSALGCSEQARCTCAAAFAVAHLHRRGISSRRRRYFFTLDHAHLLCGLHIVVVGWRWNFLQRW
jgi:hypothetical protein